MGAGLAYTIAKACGFAALRPMLNTDKAWDQWGQSDPYFGVLADDRFARSNIARHRDEFFASGRDYIHHLLRRFETQFGELRRGRALDHGCGVGRLTIPLAVHFSDVVALDVSPHMIAHAKANAIAADLTNAHFILADDDLSSATGEFDFVNSHMVLQHIPVRRGLPILYRLLDKVRPGGGFHVQLSYRTESLPQALLYWSSANIPGVKMWQNICAGRCWDAPAMQINNYPINRVLSHFAVREVTDLLVSTEQHARFVLCSFLGKKTN